MINIERETKTKYAYPKIMNSVTDPEIVVLALGVDERDPESARVVPLAGFSYKYEAAPIKWGLKDLEDCEQEIRIKNVPSEEN